MKTKSPLFVFSIFLATIGIIASVSVFIYQKYFNVETRRLSDEDILSVFSGSYFQMAGTGSAKLNLNSEFTFTYLLHTDLGATYDVTYDGTVIILNGQIHLSASDEDGKIFVPMYLIPIRWGKNKYLVEPNHISYFCEVITSDKPLQSGYGDFLQRPWGDLPSSIKSPPLLPNRKSVCL